ncbi:TrbI/VirB10 family protein [Tolypothrix sp. PCC 7910]|uniref:TrbI/VirB10 family protein n=1 Tax=Tolypothrix sp. PCC 7910 TaxID=2099387 RepID=UPI0014277FD4|nr:TrbI/VirB10 family protein [Tolypothrix sp. PCC 7910]QIR40512.1 TrbI/VirB10 family protein [Tolypothrix sp. PCC 7910]
MTQNLVSSKANSENIINLLPHHEVVKKPEVESSDWEAEIAKLVGLEEHLSDIEEVAKPSSLEISPSTPEVAATNKSFSSNPFAELILVSTVTLSIVLILSIFLLQLMGGNSQKTVKKNTVISEVEPTPKNETDSLISEVETLKTKLALTEQVKEVKVAQQQLRSLLIQPRKLINQSASHMKPSVTSRDRLPVVQTRTATLLPTVYVPRSIPGKYSVQLAKSQPKLIAVKVAPKSQQTSAKFTSQSLGSKKPLATPNKTPLQTQPNRSNQVLGSDQPNINPTNYQPPRNTQVQSSIINPQNNQTQIQPPPVAKQAQQNMPKSLAVGSNAKAVLATAVFGETSKSSSSTNNDESGKNLFVVRLKEPLKSVDGAIALSKQTELLTEINSISEQGLLQLNVLKVVSQNNQNITEISLPNNAMMIRAPQGKPLIANQFSKSGGSIAWMDAGLFMLGGLGKVADLSNRTESQVVTTTAGSTVVSNTNPKRNILTGILEGGINSLVPQITQRNQQAISQLMQRTNIWFLPAGTELQVYVNQSMQL